MQLTPQYCALCFCVWCAVFVAVPGLLAQSPAINPQAPEVAGSITGYLQFQGTLSTGVHIVVTNENDVVAFDFYTDPPGTFGLNQVPTGVYTFEVESPEFSAPPVTVNLLLQPNATVVIPLQPVGPERAKAATSRHPLTVHAGQFASQIPKKAVNEYKKAEQYSREGRVQDAMQHYASAIRIAPQFYAARNNYAVLLMKTGHDAEAAENLKAAIAVDNRSAAAYFNLGRLYLRAHNYAEASQVLETGIQRDPNEVEPNLYYGIARFALRDYATAEKVFLHGLKLAPATGEFLLQLSNVYRVQNRPADARRVLQQFLHEHPNDARVNEVKSALSQLGQ